ncbi:MAG: DNA polymerase/3'-5' exonuclease PolX [Chitinophagaceae bacterium]|nr:DNA polymerase/3'-5' exonuclease PolX [Chitinophagaceae bacterium]
MDNYQIADNFSLLSKLMDVHKENSFKSKSYSIAARNIDKLQVQLEGLAHEKIFSFPGIGEAIGKKIIEMLETGKIKVLEELIQKTPAGVLEMLQIKGLGPKKISVIWNDMGIENMGELLYACHENRLLTYTGFGEKTQNNIIEAIGFYQQKQGHYLYAQVEELAGQLQKHLVKISGVKNIFITGAFNRQEETIDELEYIISSSADTIKQKLRAHPEFLFNLELPGELLYKYDDRIKVRLFCINDENPAEKLFFTTGATPFLEAFKKEHSIMIFEKNEDELSFFHRAKLQFIPACLRENDLILQKAKNGGIKKLIEPKDIKGIIHSHSNWSDGVNTLEELAKGCIDKGFEYLVISDHSKAAFYANGLSEEKIIEQHELIATLNKKYAPFKIFKSIESDILNDGNLDYGNDLLSAFDLVIASVHSNLKMNEEKAMMRLLKAIENPYTTILGHMTGRLLLSRKGFPVDHLKLIDACAANDVVIELNAHPRRLDMRWQWIQHAFEKGVLISIDPDAHSIPEFENIKYGVLAAQKGMVSKENNLSSFTLEKFEKFLSDRKTKKGI